MQQNQLEPVSFHGDTIFAVEHEGEAYAPVKPIIENMGIDWKSQHSKLADNAGRFCVVNITMQLPGDQQGREVTCLPVRKLAGFLATINYKKVANKLKAKVLVYQRECDDALDGYWRKGRAVNPRHEEKVESPETYAAMSKPDLLRLAAGIAEENEELKNKIEADRPKVEFAESIEGSTKAIKVGDFAKVLCNGGFVIGQNRLFTFLRDEMYLMQNNMPYQNHIDNGNFVLVTGTRPSSNGPVQYFTTRITGKGQMAVEKKLRSNTKEKAA